jgi:hypothetical protein
MNKKNAFTVALKSLKKMAKLMVNNTTNAILVASNS